MGVLDDMKRRVKGALDAVTGHAAVVDVTWTGTAEPGVTATVRITVTSTGGRVHGEAAVVDLHGEDDLDENLFDKAAEFLPGQADPQITFTIVGPFDLAPHQAKTFEGSFVFPADLDQTRTWLIRARVVMPGHDPHSRYAIFG